MSGGARTLRGCYRRLYDRASFPRLFLAAMIVSALGMLAPSQPVTAGLVFSDGGTHDITTALPPGNVHVSNYTTLNLLAGGYITGTTEKFAFGISASDSTINVNGGCVVGVIGGTRTTVNFYSGTVGWENPTHRAVIGADTINVYGGDIAGGVQGGTGVMAIHGGNIAGSVLGSAGDTMIDGGYIMGSVRSMSGTVNIRGGRITGGDTGLRIGVDAGDSGVVNIYGGSISVGGGSWNYAIFASIRGTVNVFGGEFAVTGEGPDSSGIRAFADGIVNVFGSGFNYPLGSVSETSGTLTGTLCDGSALNLTFTRDVEAQVILHDIPEPATLAILTLGALAALRRRREGWQFMAASHATSAPFRR